jgi:hypothetical protein
VGELFFEDETVVGELFGFHRAKVRKRMMIMTMSRAVSCHEDATSRRNVPLA